MVMRDESVEARVGSGGFGLDRRVAARDCDCSRLPATLNVVFPDGHPDLGLVLGKSWLARRMAEGVRRAQASANVRAEGK